MWTFFASNAGPPLWRVNDRSPRHAAIPGAAEAPSRSSVQDGNLSWRRIQSLYDADASTHWGRCRAQGFDCPLDVFEQLFHDHHVDEDFGHRVRFVDWGTVRWDEAELSGVALRRVAAPSDYQYAVDEARARSAQQGVQDEREEVMSSWRDDGTWMRAPVLVAGDVLNNSLSSEILVGFTRLGNLLGLLDRREIPEAARHRTWVGHRTEAR